MQASDQVMRFNDRLPRFGASIPNVPVSLPNRFKQLKHMIGNTPLLAIRVLFRGKERVIYAKAEYLNMTGSIKDRMAFHILKKAYQGNLIQPGYTIVEATSGNTVTRIRSIQAGLLRLLR